MHIRFLTVTTALALALSALPAAAQDGAQGFAARAIVGAVYSATNSPSGNRVYVFNRLLDGRLVPDAEVPTGGAGSGDGLGNQGGVVLSRNERWLFVVNAGSHSVSVFRVQHRGLRLTDVEPSRGLRPVSITEHRGVVYVLNAGSDSIAGFRLGHDGRLRYIDGSTRALSGAGTGPAQIAFAPDGDVLMVTEKATNKITTFQVDAHGNPGLAQVFDSNGQTPFGFAFGRRGGVRIGGLRRRTGRERGLVARPGRCRTGEHHHPSAANNQSALCWLAVSPNGRVLYGTNTGSGTISAWRIGFDGELELLGNGVAGVTGGAPIDWPDRRRPHPLRPRRRHQPRAGVLRSPGRLARAHRARGRRPGANGLAIR
ncbi:MAG: beta-propeller fold lactonase family protein [Vicinamibacterales bacterium]